MDYLTRLARFVGETRLADLPAATVTASKLVLLDTIGAIEVAADPEMALKRADYPTAEVRITLTDGRLLTRATGVVRGDAANPVAPDELVAKFLALVGGPLGEPRAREIVEVIEGVDGLKDIRDLTALLAPSQA